MGSDLEGWIGMGWGNWDGDDEGMMMMVVDYFGRFADKIWFVGLG